MSPRGRIRQRVVIATSLALAIVLLLPGQAEEARVSFSQTITLSSEGFVSLDLQISRTEGPLTLSGALAWDREGLDRGQSGFSWQGEELALTATAEVGRIGFCGAELTCEVVLGDFRGLGEISLSGLTVGEAWVGAEYAVTKFLIGGSGFYRPQGLGAKAWSRISVPPLSVGGTGVFSPDGFESGWIEVEWISERVNLWAALELDGSGISGVGTALGLALEGLEFEFAGSWEITSNVGELRLASDKPWLPESPHLRFRELRVGVEVRVSTLAGRTQTPTGPLAYIFRPEQQNAQVGQELEFSALGSQSGRGRIVEYAWDFGDGARQMGRVTYHRYAYPGLYTVTLYVTDASGLSASASRLLIVTPPAPRAEFTWQPERPSILDTVRFTNLSGEAVSWFWEFGDERTSTEQNPAHRFLDKGIFTVRLTVVDRYGRSATAAKTITVINLPPVADPGGPYHGYPQERIAFRGDESSDPDDKIVTYVWDFGDGSTAQGRIVVHAYAKPGTYQVCLRVVDEDGASHQACTTAYVAVPPGAQDG